MLAQAEFIAATRPGFDLDRLVSQVPGAAGRVHRMEIPALAISSSDIRARVVRGAPIQYLVPTGSPGTSRNTPSTAPRPAPTHPTRRLSTVPSEISQVRAALWLATVEMPDRTDLRSSPLPTSLDFALTAASAASSKQARDVIVLDVSEPLVISDYFVICSGNSDRQVRAIAEAVERACRAEGARPCAARENARRAGSSWTSSTSSSTSSSRRSGPTTTWNACGATPRGRPQRRGRQPGHRLISPSLPSRTSPAQTTLPVTGRGVKERT